MPQPRPEPSSSRPPWAHCGQGAGSERAFGCPGVRVAGRTACLAHLDDVDRGAYPAGLSPGDDIDHRGTTFTQPLLDALLTALRGSGTGHARFGDTLFDSAIFEDDVLFGAVVFEDDVRFRSAVFKGIALFDSATFKGRALFESVTFGSDVRFESATFTGDAGFESVIFTSDALFASAVFESDARFTGAAFERAAHLGPLTCAGLVTLSGAVFGGPVSLAFAARRLACRRTRWSSTAELRLRHTTVDFAHAVFEYPLTLAAELDPFVLSDGQQVGEETVFGAVRVTSLRGVDAAHLVLADVGLGECLFTGTVHLDQIRLEGTCSFATVPSRAHGRAGRFVRFTRRRVLAEEHHWRASRPAAAPGWDGAVPGAGHAGPAQLAPVYRALRKALEDSKNEPGAADFYYGEMEMRRHDRTGTTRAERGLLHGYWLLSGYGLRASRPWAGSPPPCSSPSCC
ncbi:pentapeptide repeat-containing protein [Streptomyces sp. NBC_01317]|uniref:pentapeptide repeat-containing protein n=1 Tax=Streptomyces sp. NBC_01317 TaxID=2903822 RepID=UPI002E113314